MENDAMKTAFAQEGYYVLRGVLSEAEVDRLAAPIRAAFAAGEYDGYRPEKAYPAPGVYSMGPRILDPHPEIADLSLAHPAIVDAVEGLFGEKATLASQRALRRLREGGGPDVARTGRRRRRRSGASVVRDLAPGRRGGARGAA